MNRELELLILALDAAEQATGKEGQRLRAIYLSRLDEVVERRSNLSREMLDRMI